MQIAAHVFALLSGLSVAGASEMPHASTFTTLYRFQGGHDAGTPTTGVIFLHGLLYGTSQAGGSKNCGCGTIFTVDPHTGSELVLYAFDGRAGGAPNGLTQSHDALYGSATINDADYGDIFDVQQTTGKVTVLYSLTGGPGGTEPVSFVKNRGEYLYGVTYSGGQSIYGTVYRYALKTGQWAILHSFTDGADGAFPTSLIDVGAMLYGTSKLGGNSPQCYGGSGCGVVFAVNPKNGAETVLHAFQYTTDGGFPNALIYLDGALYGTTVSGGPEGGGTLFKMDPATGSLTVLHAFSRSAGQNLEYLEAGFTYHDGAFYGTTTGSFIACVQKHQQCGAVWKIDKTTGAATTLYRFTGGSDGGIPQGGVIFHGGALYGTTRLGNGLGGCAPYGCGTVYKLVP